MLSNNTILETKIQRLHDGLLFVDKGLGVHVQRMLKLSRSLYTGGNFKQYIWGKTKENWGAYLRFNDLVLTYCLFNYITRSMLAQIQKMLTYREMVNFKKMEVFFSIFLYTFNQKTVSLQGHEKCLLSIGFAFFVADNA